VISFMGAWNIYLWALLVLDSPEKRTLAVGVKAFSSIDDFEPLWGPMMAVALLSTLPVMAIFALAQRYVMAAFSGRVGE
jgi:ABC-type glycerol-3-phosphate transport system permease component